MKQTLINRLILGAIAGLAAVGANAGQIQASSVSIAREVITTDLQTITSPSIAYRFAGDVDARVQAQTFQVQFTLASGTWATLPGTVAQSIQISDGVTGQIQDQTAGAPTGVNASYQVLNTGLSADGKTFWASITVNQGATALIKQPLISLNVTSNTIGGVAATNVSASRASVQGLYSVVGDLVNDYNTSGICQTVKTAAVSFKHYVALTSPGSIATDTSATADEHTRSGATNNATLMTFPTNVLVQVAAPTTNNAGLTTGGNQTFSQTTAASGYSAYVSPTLISLGRVTLAQNATGYDGNLANTYALAGVATGADANGLDHQTTAAANVGDVEVNTVTVAVTASSGFVNGGNLWLDTTANCAGTIVSGAGVKTALTAADSVANRTVTLTIGNAQVNGAFGATGTGPVYACYEYTAGATAIPSSSFRAVGTVNKAAAGAPNNEQNNICNGNWTSIGGSIKIDVRNYASSAETSGWQSVIRLVNTSDNKIADVWAQLINQDGKLGNFVKLTDLAPRAVQNYTAAQIDASLAAGSASTAGAANTGTAAAVAVGYGAANAGAPRLRITSTTGDTLRVQNYLFNQATGQIVEGSSSQGVDFAGTTRRAPVNEGQYHEQDAQSGLNLQ